MSSGQQRQSERVGVLVHDGFDDVLGRLVQAGIDDLKSGVTQGTRDDFGAAIVTIQTGLGDHYSVGALHDYSSYVRRQPPSSGVCARGAE